MHVNLSSAHRAEKCPVYLCMFVDQSRKYSKM